MYYVEDGCERCGYYECQKCHTRFLSQYIAPVYKCPDCDNEVDMEIGPDDEMAEETTSAKLIEVIEGKENVEKYDKLLSLAITGGDYDWL